ncbi:uncharacterized protein TNCV_1708961 [Trichonephila clavipes]|nr:uncharacterized protein TNCV_1708961 [Trichonephila clavipes]
MASDSIFCHLIQQLFPYSYGESSYSSLTISKKLTAKGPLTKNLFDLIKKAFLVLEISIQETWSAYFNKNGTAMKQSAELYVWHTLSMCWMEQQIVTDTYDRFLSVIVLVRCITERLFCPTGKRFYKLTSQILTVFFENSLSEDFQKCGGWELLKEHILNKKYHEYYNECTNSRFCNCFIPKKLKLKISLLFTSTTELPKEVPCEWINDLTAKVLSSVSISLLNELSPPQLNEQKSVSQETEGSSSRETNVLEDSDMPQFSEKHINLCMSHINQLEDKLKELISIFELLESKIS